MPIARSRTTFDNCHARDRIVLFAGSPRTLDLLQLAVIRSDNVLLVAGQTDDASPPEEGLEQAPECSAE